MVTVIVQPQKRPFPIVLLKMIVYIVRWEDARIQKTNVLVMVAILLIGCLPYITPMLNPLAAMQGSLEPHTNTSKKKVAQMLS
jgi:hypothetical protein